MIFDINGKTLTHDLPIGLHEAPKTEGQLNAVKRARQLTDIKWTPVGTFDRTEFRTPRIYSSYPHVDFVDEFTAGKEYVGVPYSGKRRLGTDVMLETFITAVRTPNSVQMLNSDYDPSPDAGGFNASYYGSTCVNLTGYALDIPYVTSNSYPSYPGFSRRYKILDDGLLADIDHDLELADVLQISGHCALITDIIRDSAGTVTNIEVSEAVKGGNQNLSHRGGEWGGKAQRVMWSLNDFLALFGNYTVFRYQYVYKVKYIPSPYVPMIDEGKKYAIVDYPIVPYFGNKAVINAIDENRIVKLLLRSSLYTHVVVEKDGERYGEMIEINGAEYVEVSCPPEEAEYGAYLVNLENGEISERTFSCSWYTMPVFLTTITESDTTVNITVKMKNTEFYPWAVNYGTSDSFALANARRVFSEDISITTDGNDIVYTFTSRKSINSPTKLRVYMRSDTFGTVWRDFSL